ncbi:MAG: ribonuclease P protein component, partial [Rhodocyclaceae bacterium]|nr:ribonuclease P protein component [Rhodocyclaceae bacterium]
GGLCAEKFFTDPDSSRLPQNALAESFRFGRQHRLRKPAEYAAVFSARRVLRGDSFALHYRPNGLDYPRLGLVMPKKQARTAVLRNALKRQARELFRLRRPSLPQLDMVLRLIRKPPADPSRWREEIAVLFDKIAALRSNGGAS